MRGNMNKKNIIIFDFDGTIANTNKLIPDSIINTLNEYGINEITQDNIFSHYGPTEKGILMNFLNDKIIPEAWTYYLEEYIRLQDSEMQRIEGMDDLLERLSRHNDLLLLLLTGRSKETADISLSYLGYDKYFAKVYSGSVEGNKKDVSIYNAIEDYGLKKENMLYIGDSISDIRTMRKVGIDILSVSYCCQTEVRKIQLSKENPNNVCDSVKELEDKLFLLIKD